MHIEKRIELSRQKRILSMEYDEESVNSRVCPSCEYKFMTAHLNTKFCSEICADKLHNRKKSMKLKEASEFTNREFLKHYKINETLLNCFTYIDRKLVTTFEELKSLGFEFGIYDEIYDGKNSSIHKIIKIGDYTIERLENDKVLITNIN